MLERHSLAHARASIHIQIRPTATAIVLTAPRPYLPPPMAREARHTQPLRNCRVRQKNTYTGFTHFISVVSSGSKDWVIHILGQGET